MPPEIVSFPLVTVQSCRASLNKSNTEVPITNDIADLDNVINPPDWTILSSLNALR